MNTAGTCREDDSFPEDIFSELHELVDACLQDTATEAQVARLNDLLEGDARARRLYVRYIQTSHGLRTWSESAVLNDRRHVLPTDRAAQAAGLQEDADSIADDIVCPPAPGMLGAGSLLPEPPAAKSPVLGFLGDLGRQTWGFASDYTTLFSILAALVLVAGLVAVRAWRGDGNPNRDAGSEIAKHQSGISNLKSEISNPQSPLPAVLPVARLTGMVETNWGGAASMPEVGTAFVAGQNISLCSGAIELVFDVGVRAVVQGPAKLDLLGPGKVFLHAGKLTAEILKPEARGFEVQTPKRSVVDLGTEFAVDVTPSQDVLVHVFKGEVLVEQPAELAGPQGPEMLAPKQHVLVDQGLRMEDGRPMPWLVKESGETFIRTIDQALRDRHVVAYWRFEDQPLGTELPTTAHNRKPVRATVDSSFNGNDLYTFSALYQPTFSPCVPADVVPGTGRPNRSCLDNSSSAEVKEVRNVYTHSEFSHAAPVDIQKITPAQWTIEASVNSTTHSSEAQTFVGRDPHFTRRHLGDAPRLAFKIDAQRHFAIAYIDVANRLHEAIAEEPVVETNRWYHAAATSDGRTLRLYVDALDGQGYVRRASRQLPSEGPTALGKGEDDAEWSIGRGWTGASPGESFQGLIDEVRISDVALSPSDFLFTSKAPAKE